MTQENLILANELKKKMDAYYQFINLFTPMPYVEPQVDINGNPILFPGQMRMGVSLTANYTAGTTDAEGVSTSGKWTVTSASMGSSEEILGIINELASDELSNIGTAIVNAVLARIADTQAEFDAI